jgi:putative hemolysin
MKGMVSVLLLIGVLVVTACGGQATETPQPDMPNPASAFCEEQGYELEIRTAADGSQQGFCLFPDGSECDEWAFYRGECGPKQDAGGAGLPNPASAFCEEQGYELEIRTAADGSQQGFCLFPDGTECDEWAFYRGECGPGTPKP